MSIFVKVLKTVVLSELHVIVILLIIERNRYHVFLLILHVSIRNIVS